MGSGTGAVLEQSLIDKLPTVKNTINITRINKVGTVAKKNRKQNSTIEENDGSFNIIVGDSRKGWADAYRMVIKLAMGEVRKAVRIDLKISLGNVRPAGERLEGFGGTANPVKLDEMFTKIANLLNKARGRKLTSVEACLLIDEAAAYVVAEISVAVLVCVNSPMQTLRLLTASWAFTRKTRKATGKLMQKRSFANGKPHSLLSQDTFLSRGRRVD